jgi:hypothetical protein
VLGAVYVWGAAGATVCWLCLRSMGVSDHPKQWHDPSDRLEVGKILTCEATTVPRLRSREVGIKQLLAVISASLRSRS